MPNRLTVDWIPRIQSSGMMWREYHGPGMLANILLLRADGEGWIVEGRRTCHDRWETLLVRRTFIPYRDALAKWIEKFHLDVD